MRHGTLSPSHINTPINPARVVDNELSFWGQVPLPCTLQSITSVDVSLDQLGLVGRGLFVGFADTLQEKVNVFGRADDVFMFGGERARHALAEIHVMKSRDAGSCSTKTEPTEKDDGWKRSMVTERGVPQLHTLVWESSVGSWAQQ